MEYVQLGRAGVKVSPLCLGTMNFGPQADETTSHQIMDRALELGINFFDTANVYGRQVSYGLTETIVGKWFAQGDRRRDKVVLATKVYGQMSQWPNHSRLSAVNIRRACDESLKRLQTDHIDLYQMHHIDRSTQWDEVWQAMETLVAQGKVTYVGSSNFGGWHIAQASEIAKGRNTVGLVSEQSLYHLAARTIELEVVPACEHYGLGLIPYSPLGGGLLGGVLAGAKEGRRSSEQLVKRVERMRDRLERYEKLCADLGEQPAEVALAWLLSRPAVTAPIIGPRTLEQLNGAMRALDVTLGDDTLAALDEIFPGPGGAAPEAYAW
jgi:aryl-alcohol dehydrogenase-like predicted oxidoreductase